MMQDTTKAMQDAVAPRARLLFAGCATAAAAALVFLAFPRIDITIAGLFLLDTGGFVFNYPGIGWDLRKLFKIIFWIGLCLALLGTILAIRQQRLFGLDFLRWMFIASCLALGPGIVANVVLKDNWGRARPIHIEEFGGKQRFTPPLLRSGQCRRNCSFISGEASSIYMIFFALALILPAASGRLMTAGIVTGTAAGLVRMAQGGHFLSDVIFAGVFMALVATALHCIIFDLGGGQKAGALLTRLHGRLLGIAR